MKRRKTDEQIADDLYLGASDALHALVGALWQRDFSLLLSVEAALTEAYEKELARQPGTAANREFLARQALRIAMDHYRAHDAGFQT